MFFSEDQQRIPPADYPWGFLANPLLSDWLVTLALILFEQVFFEIIAPRVRKCLADCCPKHLEADDPNWAASLEKGTASVLVFVHLILVC